MAAETFNDLRGTVVRDVHRDDAVIITGAEYLRLRVTIQSTQHAFAWAERQKWSPESIDGLRYALGLRLGED